MSHPWLGRGVGSLLLRGTANQTVSVATVPLNLTLTAESARQDPQLGSSYAELMDLGLLDERNAVIVMLLVEKMRGQGSRFAPYIQLLPERCGQKQQAAAAAAVQGIHKCFSNAAGNIADAQYHGCCNRSGEPQPMLCCLRSKRAPCCSSVLSRSIPYHSRLFTNHLCTCCMSPVQLQHTPVV
jgi:hypothetical protein